METAIFEIGWLGESALASTGKMACSVIPPGVCQMHNLNVFAFVFHKLRLLLVAIIMEIGLLKRLERDWFFISTDFFFFWFKFIKTSTVSDSGFGQDGKHAQYRKRS